MSFYHHSNLHGCSLCAPLVKYASDQVTMKVSMLTLFHTLIPNHHGNAVTCRKSFSMFRVTSAQFTSVKSLRRNLETNAEPCLVGGKNRPQWFSVAPMMDCTDNHYRTLARLLSKHAWLYTEMIVAETIVHQKNNLDRFLAFPPEQHPIVLQVGGSNLESLAKAAELANLYSYDEINLNCGCPSEKVAGYGCFGARLMFNPKFVGRAMSAIAANSDVPVSVKCRIGVDDHDSYSELCDFISMVSSQSPTSHFIIHARKAILTGVSPVKNLKVPPLKSVTQFNADILIYRYEYFFALLRDFPELRFTLNGGITCINQIDAAIKKGASGVMVGRAAYNNPWLILGNVDNVIYGVPYQELSRRLILERYQEYVDTVVGKYGPVKPNVRQLVKPLLNLFHSEPGNSQWKRAADAALRHCKTVKSFLEETLANIPDYVLDSTAMNNSSSHEEQFTNIDSILPPPYRSSGQLLPYAEDDRAMSGSLH